MSFDLGTGAILLPWKKVIGQADRPKFGSSFRGGNGRKFEPVDALKLEGTKNLVAPNLGRPRSRSRRAASRTTPPDLERSELAPNLDWPPPPNADSLSPVEEHRGLARAPGFFFWGRAGNRPSGGRQAAGATPALFAKRNPARLGTGGNDFECFPKHQS